MSIKELCVSIFGFLYRLHNTFYACARLTSTTIVSLLHARVAIRPTIPFEQFTLLKCTWNPNARLKFGVQPTQPPPTTTCWCAAAVNLHGWPPLYTTTVDILFTSSCAQLRHVDLLSYFPPPRGIRKRTSTHDPTHVSRVLSVRHERNALNRPASPTHYLMPPPGVAALRAECHHNSTHAPLMCVCKNCFAEHAQTINTLVTFVRRRRARATRISFVAF